ncbi:MAG: arylsulfotransferase family protein [Candidatus Limnocylindrales bacterium]
MQDLGPASRWTRRRFLKVGAVVVVGGATVGTSVALGIARGLFQPAPALRTPGPSAPPLGGRRQFRSRPDLTPPRVVATKRGAVDAGVLFLTPDNGSGTDGPLIVDDAGEPIWCRPDTGMQVANLQVSEYRGQAALLWWEGTENGGIGAGEIVMADASYREIARVQAANGRTIDLHECQITPQGTALVFADAVVPATALTAAAAASPVPVPTQVMDCAIQEIDIASGALLWEWHSVDHIGFDESVVRPTKGQIYDYVHANSIDLEADGSLLVSARNTSTVYKIDRQSGEIVWRLGGRRGDFAMGPGTAFGYQHDARRRPDGTLTLFDDETPPVPARGLVLRLDEHALTASLVAAYPHPGGLTVTSQGNLQTLPNGDVFVGWGASPYCSEFGPGGDLRFDATYPAAKQSYRVFRQPWVGRPSDSPAIAVEREATGALTVFASWNGATEVDRWEILAGSDPSAMASVAVAPSTGFETAILLATAAPLLRVRALDPEGAVLGMSAYAAPA